MLRCISDLKIILIVGRRDESGPEGMSAPHTVHLLDGHILRLGQEEVDEERHDDHPTGEEEEDAELEVAEHGEEGLRNDEGEEEVDGDVDGLAGRADLEREDLAGHEPPERAPRPSEC